MIEHAYILISLAVVFGLYMTWGVGANDVANAMGTSVGSGAITVRRAILIAAVFEFAGAVLAGGHVTGTIRKGIINSEFVTSPEILVYGMLAALLASGIWLMVASYLGWPVSTTHTIVGSLIGFALVGFGSESVAWGKVGEIIASWFVSPVLGALIAFLLAISVHKLVFDTDDPLKSAIKYGPVYIFFMGILISLVTIFKGLAHLKVDLTGWQALLISLVVGAVVACLGKILIRKSLARIKTNPGSSFANVEKVFAPLCVFTACSMAFAHGSNDVANGVGPLAAVVTIVRTGEVSQTSELPLWILLLGGAGIVFGLASLGYKVMKTIGKKITELTPSRGFCAELAAAATVVLASRMGLPVSTTHIIVGAVMGVGLARGIAAIDLRVVGKIVYSWLCTVPIGAGLAIIIFYCIRAIAG